MLAKARETGALQTVNRTMAKRLAEKEGMVVDVRRESHARRAAVRELGEVENVPLYTEQVLTHVTPGTTSVRDFLLYWPTGTIQNYGFADDVSRLANGDLSTPIVLVCNFGGNLTAGPTASLHGAALLLERGFEQVHVLHGGAFATNDPKERERKLTALMEGARDTTTAAGGATRPPWRTVATSIEAFLEEYRSVHQLPRLVLLLSVWYALLHPTVAKLTLTFGSAATASHLV